MSMPGTTIDGGGPGTKKPWLGLGWHWVWFIPLCVLVLANVEWHTVRFGWVALKLAWERWLWAAVFSPSAVFCLNIIFFSVAAPFIGLLGIGALIEARQNRVWIPLIILLILLLPVVSDTLIWGSFPLTIDNQ